MSSIYPLPHELPAPPRATTALKTRLLALDTHPDVPAADPFQQFHFEIIVIELVDLLTEQAMRIDQLESALLRRTDVGASQ